MALDEAFLRLCGGEGQPGDDRAGLPAMRVYRWTRPSVSFGYFGRCATVRADFPQRAPVRRWTGGGVVAHGDADDWTYALIVPRPHPLALLPPPESYRCIHSALAAALRATGADGIELAADPNTSLGGPRQDAASGACFTHPVRADLFQNGRKVAGAAQRRTRLGLLHQGSVQGLASVVWDAAQRDALFAAFTLALAGPSAAAARREDNLAHESARYQTALNLAASLAREKYGTAAWLEKI